MEILNDCAHLMEKTVNPEVFFNHYDLYLEKLDILAEAESSGAVDVQSDSFIAMQEKLSTTAGLITHASNITKPYLQRFTLRNRI